MYKTKISVYPSCLSTLVHNDVTLSEVYDKIKNDDVLRQRTVNYRKAIEAKLPAKQLKKLKAEQFPMLMPAARFKEGRDMEHLDSYTGLCQCDIDNIPPDMMDEAKRRVRSLPFVCMYHVSMSGKGLHIYYFYQIPNEGLTPQVYQQAFIQGNECIGKAIPADYDAAHPLSDTRQEGIPTYAQWQQARLSRGGAGGYGDQQSSNCLHCRLAVLTVRELTLPLMPLLFLNFYNNEYNIYFLYTYTYLYISY